MGAMNQAGLKREAIRAFLEYYAERLEVGFKTAGLQQLLLGVQRLVKSTVGSGRQVFALGNGGSCALAETLLFDLRAALERRLQNRVRSPLLIDDTLSLASSGPYGRIFSRFLESRSEEGDLVILISSSGYSENIRDAIEFCVGHQRSCVLFSNATRSIGRPLAGEVRVPVRDQQPGEDVLLSALRAVAAACSKRDEFGTLSSCFVAAACQLPQFVRQLSEEWLATLAGSIAVNYRRAGKLFVYSLGGGGESIAARHMAHNLQWDATTGVSLDGPPRLVVSVSSLPTNVHFTGVANDRDAGLFYAWQLLAEGKFGDVLLLIGEGFDSPSASALRRAADARGITVFSVNLGIQRGGLDGYMPAFNSLDTSLLRGVAVQVLGHVLGRLVRASLLVSERTEAALQQQALLREQLVQLQYKEVGVVELRRRLGIGSGE